MDGEIEEKRVQARFVTKLAPPLKVPVTAIAVPSNLTRLGLSTIVNSLLKAGNSEFETQPFDFLINDELIRLPLDQFIVSKGISAERVIEIEYIKALTPRKKQEPSLHEDWVSAVDGSNHTFIVTGCYDNLGRIWNGAGAVSHILDGHVGAITSVCAVRHQALELSTIATASKDHTLRLWQVDTNKPANHPVHISAYKVLKGHNAAVQSVSPEPSGSMICSGSWDCTINLWKIDDIEAVSSKKRRMKEQSERMCEGDPVSSLIGHTQQVSSVYWPENGTIYSASWDHFLRKWDVKSGVDAAKIFCTRTPNCIHVGEGSSLVAVGCSDPILRIWDMRRPGTSGPSHQFSSHDSWITACKWHPKSSFHLLSASYDGKVMLWDLRTAFPLSIISSHEDKVLCADWWKGDSVISGGVDNKLCISGEIPVQ